MRPPGSILRAVLESVAFRASAAPYLLLDPDLRIRTANPSYEVSTLDRADDMAGELIFDVFPDNPDVPEARAVEPLARSFEAVLLRAAPDRMDLQRYDVRDPATGIFVDKTWLPVNSPIVDGDGRVVAILDHVEDVSKVVAATTLERRLGGDGRDGTIRGVADIAGAESRRERADRVLASAEALERRVDELLGRSLRVLKGADASIAASRSLLVQGQDRRQRAHRDGRSV